VTDDNEPTLSGPDTQGTETSVPAAPAVDLEGRYELGGMLGRGGMGEVRFAHDVRVDREVAIKLLRSEHTEAAVERFLREGRVQGLLDHPAIPAVHDLGVDAHGTPYIVMKKVGGTTLAQVLVQGREGAPDGKYRAPHLLARLVDVCLAIELAHTRGIVHRDLKPANIMLGDFGEVYVLDWGLARVASEARCSQPIMPLPGDSGDGETTSGSLLGTPGYMAPEQIHYSAVAPAADVYALGCILFEIVTGETAVPHGVAAIAATLEAQCHRPSERFPELAVAPELDDLCARATAREVEKRPSARALADAIQAYLDGDRDLEARRELAKKHAVLAHQALRAEDEEARARAMSEAGRAIVLDASNRLAQSVLAHLLLDVSVTPPTQAVAEANAERASIRQAVLSQIWKGYAALVAAITILFAFPVRHPWLIIAMIGMTATTGAIVYAAARTPLPMRSPYYVAAVWANSGTILLGAFVFGPFFIVPVFLIGSLAGALSQPTAHHPLESIVPQGLAVAIPIVLELMGLTPSTFHVNGGLVLTPYAFELTPRLTTLLLIITTAAQSLVAVVLTLAYRRVQHESRDRLHTFTWHLRQLLPRASTDR
jgi:serine/threonine-protein kinase